MQKMGLPGRGEACSSSTSSNGTYKTVTDFSPSNLTLPDVQTISDGLGDVAPEAYFVWHSRYQHVDFSFPVEYIFVYIISRRSDRSKGIDVLRGIFGLKSYVLFGTSNLVLALILWICLGNRSSHSLTTFIFYSAAGFTGQGCPGSFYDRGLGPHATVTFITLVGSMFNAMY
ncbi:unnamed protein product [Sphagnum tenellum]